MEVVHDHPDYSQLRKMNKRFDRKLIISYLNANFKPGSKRDDVKMQKILTNLIEKKLLHVHCSKLDRDFLSLICRKKYKYLLNSHDITFIESKDKLLFISI